MTGLDNYEVLGIKRGASSAEIKAAFRTLVKTHHPDRGGNPLFFRLVRDAYATLEGPPTSRQPSSETPAAPGGSESDDRQFVEPFKARTASGDTAIVVEVNHREAVLVDGTRVPVADVRHPDWHPSLGLTVTDQPAAATPPDQNGQSSWPELARTLGTGQTFDLQPPARLTWEEFEDCIHDALDRIACGRTSRFLTVEHSPEFLQWAAAPPDQILDLLGEVHTPDRGRRQQCVEFGYSETPGAINPTAFWAADQTRDAVGVAVAVLTDILGVDAPAQLRVHGQL